MPSAWWRGEDGLDAQRLPTFIRWVAWLRCQLSVSGQDFSRPRIGEGEGGLLTGERAKSRVDIVHTELCTLHLNPARHEPRDIVAQSLFADGLIKYSVHRSSEASVPGLEVLRVLDRVLPDSVDAMTWMPEAWGMAMHLDRSIPILIGKGLPDFLEALVGPAGLSSEVARKQALFAIHPGGPRVLDHAERILELSTGQVHHSRAVLREHGNMSSATLPFIWKRMIEDPHVEPGSLIVSFAFGPGLTICGSLLRKKAVA